jgi:hypothetical protein
VQYRPIIEVQIDINLGIERGPERKKSIRPLLLSAFARIN